MCSECLPLFSEGTGLPAVQGLAHSGAGVKWERPGRSWGYCRCNLHVRVESAIAVYWLQMDSTICTNNGG